MGLEAIGNAHFPMGVAEDDLHDLVSARLACFDSVPESLTPPGSGVPRRIGAPIDRQGRCDPRGAASEDGFERAGVIAVGMGGDKRFQSQVTLVKVGDESLAEKLATALAVGAGVDQPGSVVTEDDEDGFAMTDVEETDL